MKNKIILWLIERLYRMSYEPINLDGINRKLIKPVLGLIINGVQYWQFVNIGDMPRMRLVHYNYMRDEMTMGIDRELQVKIIDKILSANNDGDRNSVGAFGLMFKDLVTNITSIEALYNIASVMYFDKNEDLSNYDSDYNREKIKRFKTVKDKSFFFSHLLQSSLKITSEQMPDDIQKFLNENEVKLNAWKSMLTDLTEFKS